MNSKNNLHFHNSMKRTKQWKVLPIEERPTPSPTLGQEIFFFAFQNKLISKRGGEAKQDYL